MSDLLERLNNVTPDQGWAVVNKKTEGIVIWFSKWKTLNAHKEALAFMGDHPHYTETHEVREYTSQCLAHEAAAEITRLQSDKADLLEALSLLLLETEDYPELMPQTLRQARAAIAKATK